jgi:cobalt/nickel transport system permease protein
MSHNHELDLKVKENHSDIYAIDTKSKLILSIVLIIFLSFSITFEQSIFFTILIILLIILYKKIRLISLFSKTLIPLPLIIGLSFLAYLAYPNDGSLKFSTTTITYTRIELFFFYFIRSFLIVISALLVIESEKSFFEIIYSLDELKVPKLLITTLLFMYRSVFDLKIEAKRLFDARYSRSAGRKWGRSLFSLYTYKILGFMLGGILIRSFIRNGQRRDALIARGFSGKLYHEKKPFTAKGLIVLWLFSIASIIIILSGKIRFLAIGVIN